jgi:hypothetical protein
MTENEAFYGPDPALETDWFEVISPERHGVRFERSTTLGNGGTHCSFHFFRVAPEAREEAPRYVGASCSDSRTGGD